MFTLFSAPLPHSTSPGRTAVSRWALLVASTLLFFYAFLALSATLQFFAGRSLSPLNAPLAAAAAGLYFLVLARLRLRAGLRRALLALALLLLFAAILGFLSASIYDLSWDGRDYHQKAVRYLAGGWNPVTTPRAPAELYYNMWLNHYPRAPWIAAASVYILTGDIESGKVFNLLLIAAVFLASLSFFLSLPQIRNAEAVLISLALAANPVSVYQSFSFYVDGQVSSLLILLVLLGLLALREASAPALVGLAAALAVGLNLKFTGTAYVFILLAALLAAGIFSRRGKTILAPLFASAALGCILGVFILGFNPYLTNLLRFGHPFYPIYGSRQFDQAYVVGRQLPAGFQDRSQLNKLFLSIYSPSQNRFWETSGPLKNPFSVSLAEIKDFKNADIRVGGWGPLFGALLILSALALLLVFIESPLLGGLALASVCLVGATALLNPEVWWARYSPQLYLIPVILLVMLFLSRLRLSRVLGYLVLALLLANASLVSGAYLAGSLLDTWQVRLTLNEIRLRGDEIQVYYGPLDATITKLEAFGISYKPVDTLEDLVCPQELAPQVYYAYPGCTFP